MAYRRKTYQKKEPPKKVFKMDYAPSIPQENGWKATARITGIINSLGFDLIDKQDALSRCSTLLFNACAGSGKTTLILLIISRLVKEKKMSILLTSFANSIVNELQSYVWQFPGVTAQGLHSIGFNALKKNFGRVDLKKGSTSKTKFIAKEFDGFDPWDDDLDGEEKALAFKRAKCIDQVVNLIKVTLTDWNNSEALLDMIAQYGVDTDEVLNDVLDVIPAVMKKSVEMTSLIDFADMLFLPVYLSLPLPQFDIVFGDESQDYNRAQQELIHRMSDKHVLVGDRFQAIYGFTGADTQSIPNIIEKFGAVELPLDVNYRCGKNIVKLAQEIVGEFRADGTHTVINAWENSPDGEVVYIEEKELYEKLKPGDFVSCRKNAPLVGICFNLIKRGIRSSLKGKDVSQQIIDLFNKVCKTSGSIEGCLEDIENYRDREERKLNKRFKDGAGQMIEILHNKADTLVEFVSRCKLKSEVIPLIEELFNEETYPDEIALGSCHYSKGLEFDRCFVLEWDDFMTMYKNSTPSDYEQRRNLKYIAVTRAKKFLCLVNKPPKSAEEE